ALRTTSAYRWIIWPAGRTGGKCRGGFPAVQRNLLLQGAYSLFTKPDIANAPFCKQLLSCLQKGYITTFRLCQGDHIWSFMSEC
ncbi:hypothetical protein BFDFBN_BFDFBN_16990, partial [Dysosmobacter welbionis]